MKDIFQAVLFGTAVGDSLGLPAEGLSARRIAKRWQGRWEQRLAFNKGMISDDTEHTVFVAQCLLAEPQDAARFQRRLAWKLRWWLVCIPAGIGFATLRAILKLWLGFPPSRSGVFSAGNGPAMRSALIGGFFREDHGRIRDYVRASTHLTHTDPKAETAALAVALTAAWAATHEEPDISKLREMWLEAGTADAAWIGLIDKLVAAHSREVSVADFAKELGLGKGVTGYCYHTVPIALYAWLRHFGDFRSSLVAVLDCGGDTDTVGAITGALAAVRGEIPSEWVEEICDAPVSVNYLRALAGALVGNNTLRPSEVPAFGWAMLPFRNVFFSMVILIHGFRRLLPF